MDNEYEYSFKSKSIKEFIDYCINNNYELINEFKQIRRLYKNDSKVMARITKNIYKDKEEELLSFKRNNKEDNILKVSSETKDLVITNTNKEFVNSLLDILDLSLDIELIRYRKVYQKGNVIFEIDEYESPLMKVVAIEGIQEDVDKVYNELKELIDNNIINE